MGQPFDAGMADRVLYERGGKRVAGDMAGEWHSSREGDADISLKYYNKHARRAHDD